MKNTKIVSTLGPATDSKQKIDQITDAGVNVIRLNYSHGNHQHKKETLQKIRETAPKTPVMADTQGPEIRTGKVEKPLELEPKQQIKLILEENYNGQKEQRTLIPVQKQELLENLEIGDEISVDDGKIELQVTEEPNEGIICEVIFGGKLDSNKSINVTGKDIGLVAPTEKDRKDIKFAARNDFDFISLSFVKKAEDVEKVREILKKHDSEAHIISKIEHRKAVDNFDDILEASDAIMVARGDLGVEISTSKLPIVQKEMIQKCNKAGKPVITATHMLESMTGQPTPTRAEISDVANAVLDGTDAVMLSGETAIGQYPVKTVRLMDNIVREVETQLEKQIHHTVKQKSENTREIICKNVWQAARDGQAEKIIAHTASGSTARNIAKFRPEHPIIAFTNSEIVERQLQLVWGVQPYYETLHETVDEMIKNTAQRLMTLDKAEKDEKIVLTAGIPTSMTGTTNMMQIRTIEQILEN